MAVIQSPLITAAEQHGDAPALLSAARVVTYSQLARLVCGNAKRLEQLGIGPGSQVGILSENTTEYVVLLLALLHRGAIACPISTRIPQKMAEDSLVLADCEGLVVSSRFDEGHEFPNIKKIRLRKVADLSEPIGQYDLPDLELDREASVVFTSGTTSTPKAVVHTFANHYYNALGSNRTIAGC